jgi:hypothetical protein
MAERPSLETWSACAGSSGERTFLIAALPAIVLSTSLIVARKAGSLTVLLEL